MLPPTPEPQRHHRLLMVSAGVATAWAAAWAAANGYYAAMVAAPRNPAPREAALLVPSAAHPGQAPTSPTAEQQEGAADHGALARFSPDPIRPLAAAVSAKAELGRKAGKGLAAEAEPGHREVELTDLRPSGLAGARPPAGQRVRPLSYTVRSGDTLWSVAQRFRTDVATLAAINPGLHPRQLQPGQTIRVLANGVGTLYQVRPGESAAGIARRHGISQVEFMRINGLRDQRDLAVGREVILPGVTPPPPRFARDPEAQVWRWPVKGVITSEFGPRWGKFHYGLDIAVPTGTPAVAARSGLVVEAGWSDSYGYTVVVDHGDGSRSRYAHGSELRVQTGQAVQQGDVLLLTGSTGFSTGPHLHFEVAVAGVKQDPRRFLP